MEVTKSIQGSVVILAIRGPFAGDELMEFDAALDECVNSGLYRVVLDMRQSPFIDSQGLERLQDLVSDLGKRGGDLRLASPNDVCRDIFLATRMDSFVQVADDRESAIRSLM